MKLCTQCGFALLRLRVRFAGLADGLRADPVFDAGERQQVAQLGRVDHDRGMEANAVPMSRSSASSDRMRSSAVVDRDGLVAQEDAQASARFMRREQLANAGAPQRPARRRAA